MMFISDINYRLHEKYVSKIYYEYFEGELIENTVIINLSLKARIKRFIYSLLRLKYVKIVYLNEPREFVRSVKGVVHPKPKIIIILSERQVP